MPSLYAEIEINATAAQVWDALVRKEDWRYWNTFLYDCDPRSNFTLGREVFLAMQRIEGDVDTEFQPVVTTLRPGNCLRWVSKIPGLKTEHSFEMQEIAPGRTRYLHRDIFTGPLSGVFLPFIRDDEREGLRRMAQQLKRYVESGGQPQRDPYGNPYGRRGYGDPYGGRGYEDRRYEDRDYGGYSDSRYYPEQGRYPADRGARDFGSYQNQPPGQGYRPRDYTDQQRYRDPSGYPEPGYSDQNRGGYEGQGYRDQNYGESQYDSGRYQNQNYGSEQQPDGQGYGQRGYDDRSYSDQNYGGQSYGNQNYEGRNYEERGRDRTYSDSDYAERRYRDDREYRDDQW